MFYINTFLKKEEITYSMTIARAGYRLDYELSIDIPYLALAGRLWSVFCEYLEKNIRIMEMFNNISLSCFQPPEL